MLSIIYIRLYRPVEHEINGSECDISLMHPRTRVRMNAIWHTGITSTEPCNFSYMSIANIDFLFAFIATVVALLSLTVPSI